MGRTGLQVLDNRERSTDRPMWLDPARLQEVLRLARRHWQWRELLRRGWDVEDLEQEVLLLVWQRQERNTPYDPSREGVGGYFTMLTGGILDHLYKKRKTRKATSEQLGAVQVVDGEATVVDAALVAVGELEPPYDREAVRRMVARVRRDEHRARQARGRRP